MAINDMIEEIKKLTVVELNDQFFFPSVKI